MDITKQKALSSTAFALARKPEDYMEGGNWVADHISRSIIEACVGSATLVQIQQDAYMFTLHGLLAVVARTIVVDLPINAYTRLSTTMALD